MSRSPRIALEPEALRALKMWAAMVNEEPSALLSRVVMGHLPSEIKGIMAPVVREVPREKEPLTSEARGAVAVDDPRPKKRFLADDPTAIAKIKEMWAQDPRPSFSEMATITGWPKATIAENVKKMKEKGELQE